MICPCQLGQVINGYFFKWKRTVQRQGYVWNLFKYWNLLQTCFYLYEKRTVQRQGYVWNLFKYWNLLQTCFYLYNNHDIIHHIMKIYHLIISHSWIERNCPKTWHIVVEINWELVIIVFIKRFGIWNILYIFSLLDQKTVQRHASTTKNFLSPRKNMFYPYKKLKTQRHFHGLLLYAVS